MRPGIVHTTRVTGARASQRASPGVRESGLRYPSRIRDGPACDKRRHRIADCNACGASPDDHARDRRASADQMCDDFDREVRTQPAADSEFGCGREHAGDRARRVSRIRDLVIPEAPIREDGQAFIARDFREHTARRETIEKRARSLQRSAMLLKCGGRLRRRATPSRDDSKCRATHR